MDSLANVKKGFPKYKFPANTLRRSDKSNLHLNISNRILLPERKATNRFCVEIIDIHIN